MMKNFLKIIWREWNHVLYLSPWMNATEVALEAVLLLYWEYAQALRRLSAKPFERGRAGAHHSSPWGCGLGRPKAVRKDALRCVKARAVFSHGLFCVHGFWRGHGTRRCSSVAQRAAAPNPQNASNLMNYVRGCKMPTTAVGGREDNVESLKFANK